MNTDSIHIDKILFDQIALGDEASFKKIFEFYRIQLFDVAFKLTKSQLHAEEIIQETFINLWISRTHLSKVDQPANYLYRILFNKITAYLKKESNQSHILKAAIQCRQPDANATQDTVDVHESERLIENALQQLPPQQKAVYRLSRQQGMNNDEIAKQLNISPHTVKSHLSKALEFIRAYLKDAAKVITLIATMDNNYLS